MREIKFRAWDGSQMLYPQETNSLCVKFFGVGRIPWGVYDVDDDSRKVTGDPNAVINIPGVLMQFTGLKDKNGKEIWEGDIIRSEIERGVRIGPVVYDDGFCAYLFEFHPSYFERLGSSEESELEVIGNIYENPELLKQ